jgi:hypothetical protein
VALDPCGRSGIDKGELQERSGDLLINHPPNTNSNNNTHLLSLHGGGSIPWSMSCYRFVTEQSWESNGSCDPVCTGSPTLLGGPRGRRARWRQS